MGASKFSRDAWREHDRRLTLGGKTIPQRGRCLFCSCPLYTDDEALNGRCVDCELFRRRMDGVL